MSDSPAGRRQTIVSAVVDARQLDDPVRFMSGAGSVVYDDRTLRLAVGAEERRRLEALLEEYHVFKIQQPETRKADDEAVYLSAVTDPKHAADFVEALFREVYDADEAYELEVA